MGAVVVAFWTVPPAAGGALGDMRRIPNAPSAAPTSVAPMAAATTPRDDPPVRVDDVKGALVAFGEAGSIVRGGTLVAGTASGLLVGEIDPGRFTLTPAATASASESSAALWKRRAGSFSTVRANHASKAGLSDGTSDDGAGAGAVHTFTRRSPTETPSNGSTPHTHLNAMTPIDQRSERWSISRRPRACSGDM